MGRRQFVASSVAAAAGAALVRTNTICRTALRGLGVPGAPTVSPTVKEVACAAAQPHAISADPLVYTRVSSQTFGRRM